MKPVSLVILSKMPTKKIPISFSDTNQIELNEAIDLLGISGVYGDVPKAVKFGINLLRSAIKNPEKVYQDLDDSEMEIYFQSILRYQKKLKMLKKAEKLQNDAEKV